MNNRKEDRFKYRYKNSFLGQYEILKSAEEKYLAAGKNPSKQEKHLFGKEIKHTYEFGWKTMKDYLKQKGIISLLPRKIILQMNEEMPADEWISLLEDINTYIVTKDEQALDRLTDNYFKVYKNLFVKFCKFFDEKVKQDIRTPLKRTKPVNANHSVLDSSSFYLFINYFLKHPKIKFVRIYGSRAASDFRASSDVDFIMGGTYTQEEFTKIEKELKALRQPYMLDITDANDKSTPYKKEYVEVNLKNSIAFYDIRDFM